VPLVRAYAGRVSDAVRYRTPAPAGRMGEGTEGVDMATNARRVALVVLAAALLGAACLAVLVLGPRLAIPDESGRAVDVAPVVVTPTPTSPAPTEPSRDPAPASPAPSATDAGGTTVVPGPEPVEVGDDNGGDRGGDDGGGSGRDHPEDD
jgi:hypothetical protein